MKRIEQTVLGVFVLAGSLFTCLAQSPSTGPLLKLEQRTNVIELTVSSLSATGALFILQATNLQALVDSPSLLLQTNNASTNDVLLRVTPAGGFAKQGFFTAAHWPGLSTDDFGDPEAYPDEPPPDMVLVTAGVPDPLVSGQQFTVDFFVIDPAGQLLNLTQAVSVRVLRESDGAIHPDAQVSPSTGQLVAGHLRLTITITAITSLDGYTLGLGPGGITLLSLTSFLKTAFTISTNISITTSNELYQALEARRTASADPNLIWAYPLSGADYPVSGTFGEWRGDANKRIHAGLDLAATHASAARASRGGVVSARGLVSESTPMGYYVTVDHGGGWFSRYLHLEKSKIAVKEGQIVQRGDTIATNLFTWSREHLHFEIRRRDDNKSQWNVGTPGSGQDPLQISDINPDSAIFPVPPGQVPPVLEEIGLTRKHPATSVFQKSPPMGDAIGPVFFFAKFLDKEPKPGGVRRLSLRAMGFQPEGVSTNAWIWTSNETAIATLLPPLNGAPSAAMQKGFALYKLQPDAQGNLVANTTDYFRYWWKWDTAIYTNATGPRSIVLTGVDYGGATSNYTFTFGPQIKSNSLTLVGQKYWFTNVAYLGTNTSVPAFVQPDQYKLQILQTNGQPLPGVTWTPTLLAGDYTRVFTAHLEEGVYAFTLPGSPDGLKLRVSSRLATNIAHEICLCGGPDMAFIPAGSFTMGSDEYPGSNEQPTHTVYVSAFCMDKYEVTKAL